MSSLELHWQERYSVALPLSYNQHTINWDPFSNFLKSLFGLKCISIHKGTAVEFETVWKWIKIHLGQLLKRCGFICNCSKVRSLFKVRLVHVKPQRWNFISVNDQLTSFSAHWGSILMTQLLSCLVMGQLIEGSSRGWGKTDYEGHVVLKASWGVISCNFAMAEPD